MCSRPQVSATEDGSVIKDSNVVLEIPALTTIAYGVTELYVKPDGQFGECGLLLGSWPTGPRPSEGQAVSPGRTRGWTPDRLGDGHQILRVRGWPMTRDSGLRWERVGCGFTSATQGKNASSAIRPGTGPGATLP